MNEEIITCSNCGYETSEVDTATELCQTCKNAYELGYQAHAERRERMTICEHEICTVYGKQERGVSKFALAICDACGIEVEGDIN